MSCALDLNFGCPPQERLQLQTGEMHVNDNPQGGHEENKSF
jgi:hypothetical protein